MAIRIMVGSMVAIGVVVGADIAATMEVAAMRADMAVTVDFVAGQYAVEAVDSTALHAAAAIDN